MFEADIQDTKKPDGLCLAFKHNTYFLEFFFLLKHQHNLKNSTQFKMLYIVIPGQSATHNLTLCTRCVPMITYKSI